jgi:hypothetical protein
MLTAGSMMATALVGAPPAHASCGTDARVSPYAFVPNSHQHREEDHIATVIIEPGDGTDSA